MKFCKYCMEEISTPDGVNTCEECETGLKTARKKAAAKLQRKLRDQALKDLGLIKVRGAMGGVYYE